MPDAERSVGFTKFYRQLRGYGSIGFERDVKQVKGFWKESSIGLNGQEGALSRVLWGRGSSVLPAGRSIDSPLMGAVV